MSEASMSEGRVCDCCRSRKTKCDRGLPCHRCRILHRECTYTDVPRKRGPRRMRRYPRIVTDNPHAILPRSNDGSNILSIDTNSTTPDLSMTGDSTPDFDQSYLGHLWETDKVEADLPLPDLITAAETPDPRAMKSEGIVPPSSMTQTVHLYIKHIYPLMPVFDISEVLQNLSVNPGGLTPQRYSFLSSLSAATRCQLSIGEGDPSCEPLLADALWARKQYDVVEDKGIDVLLSSFFLFIAYWSLDREGHAWFYLQQSIGLALARDMHREDQFEGLSAVDAEYRRQIFWTLFATERTFCLIYEKPIVLQPSIGKPQELSSRDRDMIGGFVRIAGMFENLSIEPSVWATAGYVTPISLKECIEEDISQIQELEDIGQIQKLELLISGRWLQAKMWKFSAKRQTAFYVSNDPWQLRQPVVIGRAVLDVLESFSTVLMESHSIALDRKLYDIGECICDVVEILQRPEERSGELETIFFGLLQALSKFKERNPHFLSNLQQRAQALFL